MTARHRAPALILLLTLVAAGCSERAPTDATSTGTHPATSTGPGSTSPGPSPRADAGWRPSPFRAAPYAGWLVSVPDSVPVDHRLPASDPSGVTTGPGVTGRFCGTDPFPTGDVLDRVTAQASGPEHGEARDLRLFADDRAAHRFLVQAAAVLRGCPTQDVRGTLWRHELRASTLDAVEGFTVVRTFETDGTVDPGSSWWEVARVGNAVLLTATGGEWRPGGDLDDAIRVHGRRLGTLVGALCSFSFRGCVVGEPAADIPVDFPLAAGWPDEQSVEPGGRYGLEGPGRQVPRLRLEACGTRLGPGAARDRVGARWSNVEDHRERELTTYDDAGGAARRVAAILEVFRACPSADRGDGYTEVITVRRTSAGGESWAIVRRSERDGAPAVGLQVLHVVRLGRAVLVDTVANEGGAGQDLASDVRRQIRYQSDATGDVVSAMCLFTQTGCA